VWLQHTRVDPDERAEESLVDADEEQHRQSLLLSGLVGADVEEHCSNQDAEDDGLNWLSQEIHPCAHYGLHRPEKKVPHLREPRGSITRNMIVANKPPGQERHIGRDRVTNLEGKDLIFFPFRFVSGGSSTCKAGESFLHSPRPLVSLRP
jgi:hypothetical protein